MSPASDAISRRVLVSGYYGCGNVGDESVLYALQLLVSADVQLRVLSGDVDYTRRIHGCQAVPRFRPDGVARGLQWCDTLLSGGGSLLQDVTSGRSLQYYLGVLRAARLLRRRVVVWCQGIGPVRSVRGQQQVVSTLRGVDHLSVRDSASAERLATWSDNELRASVAADPALLLTPQRAPWPGPPPAAVRAPAIAVAPRMWSDGPGTEYWVQWAQALRASTGASLVLFPMQPVTDEPLCQSVAEAVDAAAVVTTEHPLAVREALAQCDFVVGVRLHALVLAAAAGVPGCGIAYDPKVTAFCDDMGYACREPLDAPQALARWVREQYDNRQRSVACLRDRAEKSRRRIVAVTQEALGIPASAHWVEAATT